MILIDIEIQNQELKRIRELNLDLRVLPHVHGIRADRIQIDLDELLAALSIHGHDKVMRYLHHITACYKPGGIAT